MKFFGFSRWKIGAAVSALFFGGAILLLPLRALAEGGESSVATDWPCYGRDPGGERHSPLSQINRDNVSKLQLAWTYHTKETYTGNNAEKAAFEATPIVVEGTMYLSTPRNRVIALDPATGTERWVFDPEINLTVGYSEMSSRGVSSWADSKIPAGQPGHRRIYVGTLDARLIALDAATGKPCEDFGEHGAVDLTEGIVLAGRGNYQVTSPPAIIGDLVVVGSSEGDNRRVNSEHGIVRALDARTGKTVWSWDPIPRKEGDPGWETWKGPKAAETGAANAWSVIAADPERDLVFIPTSCPSPDFYGGERIGQTLYANTLVAMRASTGKMVWHYQVVHHDIWDYDIASPPALITVKRDGKNVPAVAVGTKMGHIFFFNRDTGEPLFPIEERPVPKSNVPGEEAWPTQPFPKLPPPLGLRSLKPEDGWGRTDAEREYARKRIASLRYEGPFTPVGTEETIVAPSNIGGAHWGGVSFDPASGLLIVNTNRIATIAALIPRENFIKEWRETKGWEFGPQSGTPYGLRRRTLLHPNGLPLTPPPWGVLTAIDTQSGKIRWEVPIGSMANPAQNSDAEKWGSINLGGSITTAGGLVFIAATLDGHLRAIDIESGKELWRGALPVPGIATPMTYSVGAKQFVVIAAGGHGKMKTKLGDSVMAFALP